MSETTNKTLSCMDCINHDLASNKCPHAIYTKMLNKGNKGTKGEQLFSRIVPVSKENHNDLLYNACLNSDKPL